MQMEFLVKQNREKTIRFYGKYFLYYKSFCQLSVFYMLVLFMTFSTFNAMQLFTEYDDALAVL